jgi:hypothetical protein
MMAASAGYLSSLVSDMSSGASSFVQPKEQTAFGIWNDENNNTHPLSEFTIIDPFWLEDHHVVVVAANNNEPSGTHHGAEWIDLISMSANGTTDVCSCHCNCQKEEQTTSSTTVQLAQRFDQAMESAADSWNQVRQQTEWAATDFRNTVVNDYDHYFPTIYHRLLTTATETKTATVEYMSDSLSVFSTHTASNVLRSLLSPLLMQRSSPPPTTIAIDEENTTKNRTISTYFLAMYDDNYNKHSAATMSIRATFPSMIWDFRLDSWPTVSSSRPMCRSATRATRTPVPPSFPHHSNSCSI